MFGSRRLLEMRWRAALAVALAVVAAAVSARAQDGPAAPASLGVQAAGESYPAAFFTPFAPQTALDMVRRLPGFSLDAGTSLRGFGAGAGNVLVDGSRPTSESGGLLEALARISASQVERIEVLRGTSDAGEAQGQTVVANIVRRAAVRSGGVTAYLERNSQGLVYPAIDLTLAGPVAGWEASGRLNAYWEQFPMEGTRANRDATGQLTSSGLDDRPTTLAEVYVSGEARRPFAGGRLQLNGRFGSTFFYYDQDTEFFRARLPGGPPDSTLRIEYDRQSYVGEFGGDWTRSLPADWSLKLLSLTNFELYDQDEDVFTDDRLNGFGRDGGSALRVNRTPFETVARATLSRGGDRPLRPEIGGEVAYNRLDSALALAVTDRTGTRPIEIPAADVLVQEVRGEAFANLVWRVTPRLRLEAGLAAEASRISVSGDAESEQSFVYFKPSATAAYDLAERLQLRASIRRTVGQLDFTDFAASSTAADDRQTAGNPELRPDQTTRLAAAVDWRFGARGALNVELFHEWRSDVLEIIRLPSGFEGLGNAGEARFYGVAVSATLPTDPYVSGGVFTIRGRSVESTFEDPLTGRVRDVTGLVSPALDVEFRQDLPEQRFAYGIGYVAPDSTEFYYLDEVDVTDEREFWRAYVETTRFFGVKTTLALRNLGLGRFYRRRDFFAPDRGGAFVGSEERRRHRGMFVRLTVSRQF